MKLLIISMLLVATLVSAEYDPCQEVDMPDSKTIPTSDPGFQAAFAYYVKNYQGPIKMGNPPHAPYMACFRTTPEKGRYMGTYVVPREYLNNICKAYIIRTGDNSFKIETTFCLL